MGQELFKRNVRVFDPFLRQKGRKWTGLGLHVVKRIMNKYDGLITLDSSPGNGNTCTMIFPATAKNPKGEEECSVNVF